MRVALDVVDLLQLQEIWSKRPIITAFTRLEVRSPAVLSPFSFSVDELLPRLARLKHSAAWRSKDAHLMSDPARIPLADFSEAQYGELYPEVSSPAEQRQLLFNAVYNRFVVTCYRGSVEHIRATLQNLVHVRGMDPTDHLGADSLPLQGSPEWIPLSITDEIRGLDERYNPVEPGAPAAYVIADTFWPLLVKAASSDIEETIRIQCNSSDAACADAARRTLAALSEVAYTWNRSPSVVGLCYQLSD